MLKNINLILIIGIAKAQKNRIITGDDQGC